MAIRIDPLTTAFADPCLTLAAELFAAGSTLHIVSGLDAPGYRADLKSSFLHKVDQGLSVVAVN